MPFIPIPIKIGMSILLSILSVILYLRSKTKVRSFIMIGMLLSTFGDTFMIDDLCPNMVLGAGGFILAHFAYAYAFYIGNDKKVIKNNGFKYGIIFMVVSAIALEVLGNTIPSIENRETIFGLLLLVYIAVIGLHLVMNFSYSFNKKGKYYICAIGVLLFYLTDLWIFNGMLNIEQFTKTLVWWFYPLAQLLIIIFSEPIKKVD